jgi:hypothetical protein
MMKNGNAWQRGFYVALAAIVLFLGLYIAIWQGLAATDRDTILRVNTCERNDSSQQATLDSIDGRLKRIEDKLDKINDQR